MNSYQSPQIRSNRMEIVDKLQPLNSVKDGSESKPKSALKKHSSYQKRRVSFSDNKIVSEANLNKTDSK